MTLRSTISLVLAMACASATHADGGQCDSLAALDWLRGTWRAQTVSRVVTETWWRVSPHTFEGVGRTEPNADDKPASSETLRLVTMQDQVFYIAMVDSNPLPVAFRLTECAPGWARFDNPQHDFPRRLDYRLHRGGNVAGATHASAVHDESNDSEKAADVLTVDVSDGDQNGFTLRYVRSAPPAAVDPHADARGDEEPVQIAPH